MKRAFFIILYVYLVFCTVLPFRIRYKVLKSLHKALFIYFKFELNIVLR